MTMWKFTKASIFSFTSSLFFYYFATCLLNSAEGSGSFSRDFIRKPKVCIGIPPDLKLCQNVGYPEMLIPNLLNHDSLEEVKQQALSFVPLLNKGCHPYLQRFLCSLFAPVCLPPESAVTGPIPPCKSLCVSVERACTPILRYYNFDWPSILNCSKFVEEEPCVNFEATVRPSPTPRTTTICAPCGTELDVDSLHDNYCASEFVLKIRLRKVRQRRNKGVREIVAYRKKRTVYKQGPLTKRDLRRLKLVVKGAKRCQCPQLDRPEIKAKKRGKKNQFYFLVMGRKVERKLMVTVLHSWQKRNRALKRANRTRFESNRCPEFGNARFS